jgi:hypothetical protein
MVTDRDGGSPAPMDTPPVRSPSHLGRHLVQREVQRSHLLLRRRLGTDHGPLRVGGQLDAHRAVVLPGVAFTLDLDLDPDDPMVVLLQSRQLLGDVTSEPVRELAMTSRDHNFHVNLR